MLHDELEPLRDLVNEVILVDSDSHACTTVNPSATVRAIKATCTRITDAWLAAVFSEAPDHSLERYFYFHLEGISNLADTLFKTLNNDFPSYPETEPLQQFNEEFLSLISHLRKNHRRFFNEEANSPLCWRNRTLNRVIKQTSALISSLQRSSLPPDQSVSIISYLQEMLNADNREFCSFHALAYFEQLVSVLSGLYTDGQLNEMALNKHLLALDFNHFAYLAYRQEVLENELAAIDRLPEKAQLLLNEKRKLTNLLPDGQIRCHSRYPSLVTMLAAWMDERMALVAEQSKPEDRAVNKSSTNRIYLNISVAQMGCLLRVLYEENYFGDRSLSDIFKFVAENFSSKKQEVISVGGLTKEYYSTTQVTAGKMIVQYQVLAARLKRIFFPLLVAASVIFGA